MEKDEQLGAYLQKQKASGTLVVKNIRLHSCILLSEDKKYYLKDWIGVLCGVAHVQKFCKVRLNGSHEEYEVWGLARQDGAFYDNFLLLSLEQGAALQAIFDSPQAGTIDLPPYNEREMKDLISSLTVSGNKLSPNTTVAEGQYTPLFNHWYFYTR